MTASAAPATCRRRKSDGTGAPDSARLPLRVSRQIVQIVVPQGLRRRDMSIGQTAVSSVQPWPVNAPRLPALRFDHAAGTVTGHDGGRPGLGI